jgi:hypothetical protein
MSATAVHLPHATALLTYLWHYTLARLLYDELVWPVLNGHVPAMLLIAAGAVLLFLLGRRGRRGRRRP